MKKLLKLAIVVGAITVAAKMVAAKKEEWEGLTEPQVREKLDSKLPNRVPTEKRSEIADKVVSKMRDRGVLADDEETADTDS